MGRALAKLGRPRKEESALSKWIDRAGLTREEFAAQLGISRPHVDRLCRGVRRPGLDLAMKIEQLTKGVVSAAAWTKIPPHSRD